LVSAVTIYSGLFYQTEDIGKVLVSNWSESSPFYYHFSSEWVLPAKLGEAGFTSSFRGYQAEISEIYEKLQGKSYSSQNCKFRSALWVFRYIRIK
jgi:hypothetical protein